MATMKQKPSPFRVSNLPRFLAISFAAALTPAAHAVTLIGWDIPVSTTTSAATSGTPASGISGTSISLGSGLVSSSSSTAWRWASLNNTTSFDTAVTGANATNDFFQWSVTTSARTTASITGSTGFLWTPGGTGLPTSAQLWASVNGGAYAQVGSTATLSTSTTEINVGTAWFGSSTYNIAAGTTVVFRAAPLGSTGGATSPKISWNSGAALAQDASLTGTSGGGAYNLVWNGTSGTVTSGQSGQFTGTDSSDVVVSNPTFETGDNVTISQSGTMNVNSVGVGFGNFTDSNASGNSAITGGNVSAGSLSKTGAGTLTLTGANTFSGGGSITAGTVVAGSSGALGTAAMTLNGGIISVTNSAVTSVAVPLTIGASGGTVDNSNDVTFSGAITGLSNVLTKTGAGKLTLSGALGTNKNGVAINFSTGSLDLSGAAKEFGGTSTLNGSVTATNTTLNLSQSSIIAGTGTLTVDGGTIATVFGSSGGSSTIQKNVSFANSVALTGASGKSLKFDIGTLSGSGTLTTSGAGGVQFNSNAVSSFSGSIVNSTALTASAQSLAAVSAISTTSSLTLDNKSVNSGATVAANITGSGAVIKTSDGDLNLTGTNGFSGGLTLTGGGVFVNAANGVGSGTITAGNTNSKVGLASGSGSSVTLTNVVNTGSLSTYVMAFSPGVGKSITLTGKVSGTGQLKISGSGDLIVSNATNDYTGGTEIGTGRIIVADDNALGANTGAVNFGTAVNSTLVSTTSGNFSASRSFTIGSSSSTGYTANIEIQPGITNTLRGVVADGVGNVNGGKLNKLGTGTLTLTGINTYTGTTTISSGTLALSGVGSITTSPNIIVGASTTFDVSAVTGGYTLASGQSISGSGTVTGTMNVVGTLSPGNSPGNLATGSQTWLTGGDYNWQILDATGTAGTGYDTISVTGTLDLSSLSTGGFGINLWSLSSILPDVNGDAINFDNLLTQSWNILTTTGGISGFEATDFTISVAANNGAGGFSNTLGAGGAFSLGTSGNNLVLTYSAVPEMDVAALLGSFGALALLRRRRA